MPGQSFSGSNMIWRRDLLIKLGGFDINLGVHGIYLILGEETALFKIIWNNSDPLLLFSPDLIVYHWVPTYKMKVGYRVKRAFAVGQALESTENNSKTRIKKIEEILSNFIKVIVILIKSLLSLFRYRKYQNWIEEQVSPILMICGKMTVLLGIKFTLLNRSNHYEIQKTNITRQ